MAAGIAYSSKNVYKNSARSVVYKGASMLLSFISAPLLLACLGDAKYGVWASLLSAVSWIYYFDLGIGDGLRIRLGESLAKGDVVAARKYVSVAYALLGIISLVVFLVSTCVLLMVNVGQVLNLYEGFDENSNLVLFVAVMFVCLNFVLGLVKNVLYAAQRASAVSALNVLGQAGFVAGILLYSRTGNGLLLVVAAIQGASQFFQNVIGSAWTYAKFPSCRIELVKPDFSYRTGVLSFGMQAFAINIAALVLNATDNILILQLFGAEAVTPYSICYKYFATIDSVFMAVVVPLQSAYTMAFAERNYRWITKNLRRAFTILVVFAVGAAVASLIFKPFATVWLGRDLPYGSGLIAGMALYCVLLMTYHVLATLVGGIGRIGEMAAAGAVQAVINVPVSIFLALGLGIGVTGVILGSVVSVALAIVVASSVAHDELRKLKNGVGDEGLG